MWKKGSAEAIDSASETVKHDPNNQSIFGPSLCFKGELSGNENVIIDGLLEGSVSFTSGEVSITKHGKISADVRARSILVEGVIDGNLYASESVSLKKLAKVRGNIYSPKIEMEDGAFFKGAIDMEKTDLNKTHDIVSALVKKTESPLDSSRSVGNVEQSVSLNNR